MTRSTSPTLSVSTRSASTQKMPQPDLLTSICLSVLDQDIALVSIFQGLPTYRIAYFITSTEINIGNNYWKICNLEFIDILNNRTIFVTTCSQYRLAGILYYICNSSMQLKHVYESFTRLKSFQLQQATMIITRKIISQRI